MSSPYRDSLDVLRNRLHALDRERADIEESYTDLFWSDVAPSIPLAPPRAPPSLSEQAEIDELTGAIEALETRLADLHSVERGFPGILKEWSEPAAEVPHCKGTTVFDVVQGVIARAIMDDPYLPAFDRMIKALEIDGNAHVLEPSRSARTATFQVAGVPFDSRCETYQPNRSGDWKVDMTVQTTVPGLFGDLQLSPQGFGAEVLIALRLKQDIKMEHSEFDGYFVVKGDVDTARAVLTDEVRASLLVIAKEDIPLLVVSRGLATLLWRFEPNLLSMKAAIEALSAIRGAVPTRSLKT